MAEKIIIHEPTKSEFKRMAVQMGYVPVVRCKDCRHMTIKYGNLRFCNIWERINGMGDDGFCGYGERRTDK